MVKSSNKKGKKRPGKTAAKKSPPKKKSSRKLTQMKLPTSLTSTRKSKRVVEKNKKTSSSKSRSHSSSQKKKASVTDAIVSEKNSRLIELNKDPKAHKRAFNKDLKQIVDVENKKIGKKGNGAKSGRSKGFFYKSSHQADC